MKLVSIGELFHRKQVVIVDRKILKIHHEHETNHFVNPCENILRLCDLVPREEFFYYLYVVCGSVDSRSVGILKQIDV